MEDKKEEEYPSKWFMHRTYTNADKEITIIWAKIICIGKWVYKKQTIDQIGLEVDSLPDLNPNQS